MDQQEQGAPESVNPPAPGDQVAALKRELREYRTLVDNATDMINRVSPDTTYLYVSPAARDLLGYEPEEMVGRSVFEFCHPADLHEARFRTMRTSREGNSPPEPVEYRRLHRDGHYVWVETVTRPICDAKTGAVREYVTTTRDISDRRHAQGESQRARYRFESICSHIEACLWITEVRVDGEFLWVYNNPAHRKSTGMDLSKPGGVRFDDVLPTESANYNRRRCQEVVDTRKTVTFDDFYDVDGDQRWSWNTLIPVIDSSGDIREIIGTGIDVTERRDVARSVLEAIEREQRRIGQDLHDGLLQQLTGTLFMTQLLERHLKSTDEKLAAEAREIASLLGQSVSQARNLAHGLFPAEVEKDGLLSALKQLAESTVERFEIPCFFEYEEPDAGAVGMAGALDLETETHLFRIAQESVANAVHHAEPNQIEIVLHDSPELLQLSVQDDGKGVSPDHTARGGIGLRSMEYRASLIGAEFQMQSRQPSRGTVVRCRLRRGRAETPKRGNRRTTPIP